MPFSPEYNSKITEPRTGFTKFYHSEEEKKEIEKLCPRMVLVVCLAGQNRSRLIAEVLDDRGYVSYHGGVGGAHPLTEDELAGHEAIIFAMEEDQKRFYKKFPLMKNLPWRILGLGDSHAARSLERNEQEELKQKIAGRLDRLGFIDIKDKAWNKDEKKS